MVTSSHESCDSEMCLRVVAAVGQLAGGVAAAAVGQLAGGVFVAS